MTANLMTPYLLFSLHGVRYGVAASAVLEIVWLPELGPAEEAPPYIAGLVNRRGQIQPVMNLNRRLGHPSPRYQLSDRLLLLQSDGMVMGLVVSEVSEVIGIAAAAIEPPPHYEPASQAPSHFLAGHAKVGDAIILLLDVARLLHAPALPGSEVAASPPAYFCPDASAEERAVWHMRAHGLGQALQDREDAARMGLAIIQMGGECFGVELTRVREFAHLRRVTPVPCCPPHIAGDMNLRGDILTLVDLRGLLHLPPGDSATQVMVLESEALCIGVPVDQVLEVVYLRPADMTVLPVTAQPQDNEYCKGVVRHGARMVSLLDLPKILAHGGLVVEDEV